MDSFSNYLFLLIANLSQQRNKKRITKLFIDGLNSLLPETAFSWEEKSNDENIIPVCTRKNNFGNIKYAKSLIDADNNALVLVQNAAQMLAIILERLMQENLLLDKKLNLENQVEQRTKEIKKLSTAVEQSANTIIITDTEGNIEYTNPKFSELTGFTAQEALGENPRILKSGKQSDEYFAKMWQTITAGKIWKGEFHNKTKSGDLFWEQVTITPIKDKTGKIINNLAIKEDITALKENEQRLNTLINASPDAISFKDGNGKWIEANKAGLELFDLTNTNYKGKTDRELAKNADFYKEALLFCEKTDEIVWQNKATTNVEEIIPMPDGNNKTYDVIKVPLFNDDNSPKGLVIIGRDITERKKTETELKKQNEELIEAKEKAEESDLLKTEFIHNMSHEIRTPLNGILGFSNLLNIPNLSDEKRKKYINIIQNSGNLLMQNIDDLLEISKLGTKQVKVVEKQVRLNDFLLKLFSIFEIKAKENKTPLYLKKGLSDNESVIFIDEIKLNKILNNLLENAIKFTNKGFIEFGYSLVETYGRTSLHENNIQLYVKDTGIGIKPESQITIFDRFSQEEKELSQKVGGLGLGLSIAKENVELIGGKITLESEKGKGATFFVTIRYKPVNSDTKKNLDNEKEKNNRKKG